MLLSELRQVLFGDSLSKYKPQLPDNDAIEFAKFGANLFNAPSTGSAANSWKMSRTKRRKTVYQEKNGIAISEIGFGNLQNGFGKRRCPVVEIVLSSPIG